LQAGQIYIDFNSVSPMTKRAVAAAVTPAGADFVEAAIMAPVPGPDHKVHVLASAPDAKTVAERLNAIGMKVDAVGDRIGDASLSKMLRSIFIKGIEALMLESLVAARHASIEERILDSVQKTLPGIDWRTLTTYNLERTVAHGARRAAEMHESAATVAELGLDPFQIATSRLRRALSCIRARRQVSVCAASTLHAGRRAEGNACGAA
jgi:3-hydroxyisobutyrate dehydrogenase-like beta-hydroxyacid dehydrogenase